MAFDCSRFITVAKEYSALEPQFREYLGELDMIFFNELGEEAPRLSCDDLEIVITEKGFCFEEMRGSCYADDKEDEEKLSYEIPFDALESVEIFTVWCREEEKRRIARENEDILESAKREFEANKREFDRLKALLEETVFWGSCSNCGWVSQQLDTKHNFDKKCPVCQSETVDSKKGTNLNYWEDFVKGRT